LIGVHRSVRQDDGRFAPCRYFTAHQVRCAPTIPSSAGHAQALHPEVTDNRRPDLVPDQRKFSTRSLTAIIRYPYRRSRRLDVADAANRCATSGFIECRPRQCQLTVWRLPHSRPIDRLAREICETASLSRLMPRTSMVKNFASTNAFLRNGRGDPQLLFQRSDASRSRSQLSEMATEAGRARSGAFVTFTPTRSATASRRQFLFRARGMSSLARDHLVRIRSDRLNRQNRAPEETSCEPAGRASGHRIAEAGLVDASLPIWLSFIRGRDATLREGSAATPMWSCHVDRRRARHSVDGIDPRAVTSKPPTTSPILRLLAATCVGKTCCRPAREFYLIDGRRSRPSSGRRT